MTAIHQFYLDRAAEAGRSAATASLATLRDRHLLAETTWKGLAVRAARVGKLQAKTASAADLSPERS